MERSLSLAVLIVLCFALVLPYIEGAIDSSIVQDEIVIHHSVAPNLTASIPLPTSDPSVFQDTTNTSNGIRPTKDIKQKSVVTKSNSFTKVSVNTDWGLPIEVQIIASLPRGVGTMTYNMVTKLQQHHPEYILEYAEASAKIMNTNFNFTHELQNDPTAIYTFSVDKQDLTFHRHEGHRCITGMSGSGGALMKFSTVHHLEAKLNAQAFVDKMFIIEIPEDTMFVLRFNGMIYHQFGPRIPTEPAFWAVSVHTNEKGGELTEELLQKVLDGEGNIPLLTEPITEQVHTLLKDKNVLEKIPRYKLDRYSN